MYVVVHAYTGFRGTMRGTLVAQGSHLKRRLGPNAHRVETGIAMCNSRLVGEIRANYVSQVGIVEAQRSAAQAPHTVDAGIFKALPKDGTTGKAAITVIKTSNDFSAKARCSPSAVIVHLLTGPKYLSNQLSVSVVTLRRGKTWPPGSITNFLSSGGVPSRLNIGSAASLAG